MNLWFVLFLTTVITLVTGLMALFWRRYYSEDDPYTLTTAELDQLMATLRGLGFERIQSRTLFDVRTWRAEQRMNHMTMVVEFGDGTKRDYTRMTCTYDHPLGQGIQILWEERLGLSRWVRRLAEVKVGDMRLDSKFIMLARDSERLEDLLRRHVREMLLDVEDGSGDVQITDESIYAFYDDVLTGDLLRKKTEQVMTLARTLGRYSARKGPISSLSTRSYNIDADQLYLREDDSSGLLTHRQLAVSGQFPAVRDGSSEDLRALDLPDKRQTTLQGGVQTATEAALDEDLDLPDPRATIRDPIKTFDDGAGVDHSERAPTTASEGDSASSGAPSPEAEVPPEDADTLLVETPSVKSKATSLFWAESDASPDDDPDASGEGDEDAAET